MTSDTQRSEWCQPLKNGEHQPRQFIVYYEDASVGIAAFDNEADAREHWEQANINWNCYLFGALPLTPPKVGSGELDAAGRDIYEVANQLEGYVDPGTPEPLARFLLREGAEAAKLADEIVRLRALAAPVDHHEVVGGETGWLIELRSDEPKWWTLNPKDEPCWTKDSLKALRFARKVDADAYISDTGWTEAFATEHIWPAHKPHDWFEFNGMKCCRTCGNVWNDTSDTRPCKGPHKVELRSALQPSDSPALEAGVAEAVATFTIGIFEDRTTLHVEASRGDPSALLARAIAVLQDEGADLASCPFHSEARPVAWQIKDKHGNWITLSGDWQESENLPGREYRPLFAALSIPAKEVGK